MPRALVELSILFEKVLSAISIAPSPVESALFNKPVLAASVAAALAA